MANIFLYALLYQNTLFVTMVIIMNTQFFLFLYTIQKSYPFIPLVVRFFGVYLPYVLVGGLGLYLFLSGQYIFRKRLFIVLASFVSGGIALLIALFIRSLYQSPRPFTALKQIVPLIDESKQSLQSFPSNHAAVFFAFGTFIYFYNTRLGALYLIAAVLMGIARVMAGVHWPLDIVVGAALGVASAYLIKLFTQGIKKNL